MYSSVSYNTHIYEHNRKTYDCLALVQVSFKFLSFFSIDYYIVVAVFSVFVILYVIFFLFILSPSSRHNTIWMIFILSTFRCILIQWWLFSSFACFILVHFNRLFWYIRFFDCWFMVFFSLFLSIKIPFIFHLNDFFLSNWEGGFDTSLLTYKRFLPTLSNRSRPFMHTAYTFLKITVNDCFKESEWKISIFHFRLSLPVFLCIDIDYTDC